MLKFAIASEGETDQAVIKNILNGFYKDNDLSGEIKAFQPLYDATRNKELEKEFGGWEILLKYLGEKRFRENVINSEYMIVQLDTDISEHTNFGVSQHDVSTQELIEKVIERLIFQIDSKKSFYNQHKEKIIFAISVHSLECWILPLYKKDLKTEKVTGCYESLQRESKKIKVSKNYNVYNKLSTPLSKNKKLMKIVSKNISFRVFIDGLPSEI